MRVELRCVAIVYADPAADAEPIVVDPAVLATFDGLRTADPGFVRFLPDTLARFGIADAGMRLVFDPLAQELHAVIAFDAAARLPPEALVALDKHVCDRLFNDVGVRDFALRHAGAPLNLALDAVPLRDRTGFQISQS
jgi:hypothetical protein